MQIQHPTLANAFHWPMTISNRQIMIMHAVRSTNDRKESKSEPHMCYMERLVKHAKHVMHVMHMMHVMLNDKELCNIVTDSTLN